ncbi:MAG: hypothetical protein ACREOO_04775 [bacterium]
MTAATHSIHVHHLEIRYKIPRSRELPSSIQNRLDHIAQTLLASAWENRLVSATGNDDGIYFIEKLEINLTFTLANGDDRALAGTWAAALHHGILQALGRQEHGVIIFQDRGEYIASFVSDLLRGRAWERWYYREFQHLRSLSLGHALVQVLTADPDTGRDALIILTRHDDLDLLLHTFNDAEIETISLRCLLPPGPNMSLPNTYPVWVEAIRSFITTPHFVFTTALFGDVARLYLSLLRERPELGPDVNLARFIYELLRLRQCLAALPQCSEFFILIESENINAISRRLGRVSEQQCLVKLIREITGPKVLTLLRDLQVATSPAATLRLSTNFGGIFLLAPTLAEIGLYDFLKRCPYPEIPDMLKPGLLFFSIALQCLGHQNAEKAKADRAVSFFAGLAAPVTPQKFRQYSEALVPAMHKAFREAFAVHRETLAKRPSNFIWARHLANEHLDKAEVFSLCSDVEPLLPNHELDSALVPVSAAVLRWFAAKLGAFSESSPDYLRRNFLESRAMIEAFSDRIAVRFLTCPLKMVLRMAGFDHGAWTLPWLENHKLEFHFD